MKLEVTENEIRKKIHVGPYGSSYDGNVCNAGDGARKQA
jgi:hypothetical protein